MEMVRYVQNLEAHIKKTKLRTTQRGDSRDFCLEEVVPEMHFEGKVNVRLQTGMWGRSVPGKESACSQAQSE